MLTLKDRISADPIEGDRVRLHKGDVTVLSYDHRCVYVTGPSGGCFQYSRVSWAHLVRDSREVQRGDKCERL